MQEVREGEQRGKDGGLHSEDVGEGKTMCTDTLD